MGSCRDCELRVGRNCPQKPDEAIHDLGSGCGEFQPKKQVLPKYEKPAWKVKTGKEKKKSD